MRFTDRITARTVADRQGADNDAIDAYEDFARWAETQTQKHRTREALRQVRRALVEGEEDAVRTAYAAVTMMRPWGEQDALMERVKDRLLERMCPSGRCR